jgi:hypothetical protein
MSKEGGSGFETRFSVSSGVRLRWISRACAFVMKVIPPFFTRVSDARNTRTASICLFVASPAHGASLACVQK